MTNTIRKFGETALLILFACCLAFPSHFAIAQGDSLEYPSVAINYIRMDEYKFTPGAPVSMVMQAENIMSSASEFRYKIQLMPVDAKYLGTTTAQYVLSEMPVSDQIQLAPKEKRLINLTYNIPAFIDGDVSLQVTAYNGSGIEVGSKQVYLQNSASSSLAKAGNAAKASSTRSAQVKRADIKTVSFTQGSITFTPKGEGSAYLLKPDSDLKITVGIDNQSGKRASVLATVSNIYSSSSFSSFSYSVTKPVDSSKVEIVIPKSALGTGVYSVRVTPVDGQKNELGYSRVVTVGVEGTLALIQAFDVKGSLPVKKGDTVTLLADWIPLTQLSKGSSAESEGENASSTVFDARLTLKNKEGTVLATKTIPSADFDIDVPLIVQSGSNTLIGQIEILTDGQVIAEYQKELIEPVEQVTVASAPGSAPHGFLFYALLSACAVFALLYGGLIVKRRRNARGMLSFFVLLAVSLGSVAPATTYAWTQLGSAYSFDHLYPEAYDSSSSTWQTAYLQNGYVPAWSKSCTKRTDTSGSNSNYVSYTNEPVSGNDKMYRGEYIWHKVSTSGLVWYTVSQSLSDQSVYPVGPYVRTGFVHESFLDRFAKLYDNMTPPPYFSVSPSDTWQYYRPLRYAVSSSTVSILDTTNYSNMNQWLQAYYTAHRGYTYPVNRDYFSDTLGQWLYGVVEAFPPGTYSTSITSQQMSELGITSSDLVVDLDAGSFLHPSQFNQSMFGLVSDFDYVSGDQASYDAAAKKQDELLSSRPGTYKLFNFLYTTRDEVDQYSSYDCVSSNMKVFTDTYEVVPNSFIDIVIFNDKNGNGVMDAGEKSIANLTNPSGYEPLPGNAPVTKDQYWNTVSCSVAPLSQDNLVHPNYYESSSTDIAFLDYSYDSYPMPNAVAMITSSDQVMQPSYIGNVNDQYMWYPSPIETPYWWSRLSGYGSSYLNNRGWGHPVIYYDSQGRAQMYTGYTGCKNLVTEGVYFNAWPDEYNDQVNLYPAPSSVTDGSVAYYKMAVNPELSSEYKVKIDTSMLPSGWLPTKEASATSYEKTVSVPNPNTNDVVYLGIKYDAPRGECGAATSSVAMWPPYQNMCAAGSVLNGVVRDSGQYYDWTCLAGSVSPTCTQRKCDAGLTFCESDYSCSATCPNDGGDPTSTSTLISRVSLDPKTVRESTDQCTWYWDVDSAVDTPVQCSIDGNVLDDGSGDSSVSRSSPIGIGKHTLACTDGSSDQSVETRCFLTPSYQER